MEACIPNKSIHFKYFKYTIHGHNLRSRDNLYKNFNRTKKAQDFVSCSGRRFFNCLPTDLKKCDKFSMFKSGIRKLLLNNPCYNFQEYYDKMRDTVGFMFLKSD